MNRTQGLIWMGLQIQDHPKKMHLMKKEGRLMFGAWDNIKKPQYVTGAQKCRQKAKMELDIIGVGACQEAGGTLDLSLSQ